MLSFTLDNHLMRQLISLNDLVADKYALLKTLPKDELKNIHRWACISTLGASCRIENAILTDSEIDWLNSILENDGKQTSFNTHKKAIEDKLSKDRQRSIEEVASCRTALLLIYQQARDYLPFTELTLRALHHEILRHYSKQGLIKGNYKKRSNSVIEENAETGQRKVVFKTANPGIETQMAVKELVDWYNQAMSSGPWPLAIACEFVYRFLAIHPFEDGNGRLGRALLLMSLLHCPNKKLAEVAYYMAIDRHIERYREEYYIVLNQCSDGKYHPNPKHYKIQFFLKYMIKILQQAMNDIDFYSQRARAYKELPESALKVLACFKERPEEKIKNAQVVAQTQLPTRTVAASLKSLVERQFIARYARGAATYYKLLF